MDNARYQLQMAEAFGYGDKNDYETFYEQLEAIERKTEDGKSGTGFFDDIKKSLATMKEKIFK